MLHLAGALVIWSLASACFHKQLIISLTGSKVSFLNIFQLRHRWPTIKLNTNSGLSKATQMHLSLLAPKTAALLRHLSPEILSAVSTGYICTVSPCFSTAETEVWLKHSFSQGITWHSVQEIKLLQGKTPKWLSHRASRLHRWDKYKTT